MRSIIRAVAVLAVAAIGMLGVSPASASSANVWYQGHVQNAGWQGPVWDGHTAGTTGKSLRLEAVRFTDPSIIAQGHVQRIGWQKPSEEQIGTTGKHLRLEAVKLTSRFDGWTVRYRVHVQGIGWMPWVHDGQVAGTTGRSLRIEAIQIRLEAR